MKRNDYSDIIDHPHHQSASRPHMSMNDRAAQFSPFAALTGYHAAVDETARLTQKRIIPDEDAIAAVDEALRYLSGRVSEHPEALITFFVPDDKKEGGSYTEKAGRISKIDVYNRSVLFMSGESIHFEDILHIELPQEPT